MCLGEFTSMNAIYSVSPDFVPEPLAWGTYESPSHPQTYFFLCTFHDLIEGPHMLFPEKLAKLHKKSISPTGRFSFFVPTYRGIIAQYTEWTDTWEEFFIRGFRKILQVESEAQGSSEE